MKTTSAPRGLKVSEKLLRDYRAFQDRYAANELDELRRDRVAERLELRILKACDLWPWTPAEIFYWSFSWLHVLAYGEKAKTRYQPFYGPMPGERGLFPEWDGVTWVLDYDDLEMIVELLDDDDKHRHRAIP